MNDEFSSCSSLITCIIDCFLFASFDTEHVVCLLANDDDNHNNNNNNEQSNETGFDDDNTSELNYRNSSKTENAAAIFDFGFVFVYAWRVKGFLRLMIIAKWCTL